MTEIKIDITDAVDRVKREAMEKMEADVLSAGRNVMRVLFHDGRYGSSKEGLAHEIIRKKIEELVLSDRFSQLTDRIVETVLEEETERAARALINSKARKHLFQSTSPNEAERLPDDQRYWEIAKGNFRWDAQQTRWSTDEDFTIYTAEEKAKAQMPIGGKWVKSNFVPSPSY